MSTVGIGSVVGGDYGNASCWRCVATKGRTTGHRESGLMVFSEGPTFILFKVV